MTLHERVTNCVHSFKDSIYQLGGVFDELKASKQTYGLRFQDYCQNKEKIDTSIVNLAVKISKRCSLEELLDSTIGELKKRLSDKEPKDPSNKDNFITIKLDDGAKKVFETAYAKFCNENGLDPSTSKSYFIETRCAEYLAEITEECTPDDGELVKDLSGG